MINRQQNVEITNIEYNKYLIVMIVCNISV